MNNLSEIIENCVQPVLKNAGFTRKKLQWNRGRGGFIDVIELELSKASKPGRKRFTIDTGVFVPSLYNLVWNRAHSGFAKVADCPVRARIGELIVNDFAGKAIDKWWDLNIEHEGTLFASESASLFGQLVFPFLEQNRSMTDIESFLERRKTWQAEYPLTRLYLALAKLELGKYEPAKTLVQSVIDGKSKAWAERAKVVVTTVLKRHG